MTKEKGKQNKRKGKMIGPSNANMQKKAPVVNSTKVHVPDPLAPGSTSIVAVSLDEEMASENWKSLPGYIFMCNPSTKLECYQYRVFGLPSGKKEVVEQIKPGAKLFLYDFELKLLYGVYEATSVGKMNSEPAAFKGKFPAQVKFKIYKECLPMPGSTLRSVIRENYIGSKFKQELSWKQVKNLITTFRPLNASSTQPALPAVLNSSLPHTTLPLAMENQFPHSVRLPAPEVPYLPRMHHNLIPAFAEHQPVSMANPLLPGYHRPPAYGEHSNFSINRQSLPTSNHVTHGTHDILYSRYVSSLIQSHPQPRSQPYVVPGAYHQQALQGERQAQGIVTGHGYHQGGVTLYASSAAQPQVAPAETSEGTGLMSYYSPAVANWR